MRGQLLYILVFIQLLGGSLFAQSGNDSTLQIHKTALHMCDSLKLKHQELYKTGQFQNALATARELNSFSFKTFGDTSYYYANSFNLIANVMAAGSLPDSANTYYLRSKGLLEFQHRTKHPGYAMVLNNLGINACELGNYVLGREYTLKALEIRREILNEFDPDLYWSLNNLVNISTTLELFEEAEALCIEMLEITGRRVGKSDRAYALALHNLASVYGYRFNYEKMKPLLTESLQIYESTFGKNHPEYLVTLQDLAMMHSSIGELSHAEQIFNQWLELNKELDMENVSFVLGLQGISKLYGKLGKYKLAEEKLQEAITVCGKLTGNMDPTYTNLLLELATQCIYSGNFAKAELLLNEVASIDVALFGELSTQYALDLNFQGYLYTSLANYTEAEGFYMRSVNILRDAGSDHVIRYANSLFGLSLLYKLTERPDQAEALGVQAYEIYKSVGLNDSYGYTSLIRNLADLYTGIGKYVEAETLYKESLEIRMNSSGEWNIAFAGDLANLGNCHLLKGEYDLAEPMLLHAIGIVDSVFGRSHPDYSTYSVALARLYTLTNRWNEALDIFTETLSLNVETVTENFEWLSDMEQSEYWKREEIFFDKLSGFANTTYASLPEAVSLNYNGALFSKSKLLEDKISEEDYLGEMESLHSQLSDKKRKLIKMESDGTGDYALTKRLKHEADSLGKLLGIGWPAYLNQKNQLGIGWQDVQAKLGTDEVAIEFVRFQDLKDSTVKYHALLLRKWDPAPVLIPLCNEDQLLKLTPGSDYAAYYDVIWRPIDLLLNGIKTVYYSPVGALMNVPFSVMYESVPGEQLAIASTEKVRGIKNETHLSRADPGAKFLMDRYNLHQLVSTRIIAMNLKELEKKEVLKSIAAIGGVNYDFLPNEGKTASQVKSSKRSSENMRFLEGTQKEVRCAIDTMKSAGWNTHELLFNDAREENVRMLEGNNAYGVLHIATHGFAFADTSFVDNIAGKGSFKYNFRKSKNPMVRCGLLLAGSNWAWTGSDTLSKLGATENGILTALEVSQMNLRKTKLVVLSACETGLGKIEGSEGTFGLLRAFKLAGVEQIIVSLWSVPDKETTELMTLFYEDLAKTENAVISFATAQKAMRVKYPTRPLLWAGFVLVR